jgi:6-pyruvoyl tetrahydropterin synthase/QueD family protein
VTVCKELVFDSAHFITDHPAKCSNLHGGRYLLHVKVRDRVDPVTGCVVDYGYLKRVANREIVERFDHHNLNYAASALAWRSSTEMLSVYIWERLIDYLPGLVEIQLYETTQSWCHYAGPSLEEFQNKGEDALLTHFTDQSLGGSSLREQLKEAKRPLQLVVKS